ncbi:MAG: PorV/PorQ family protein [FCB group bacterium]|nr:PorV/PorQ family protein [FCB group bacterium]
MILRNRNSIFLKCFAVRIILLVAIITLPSAGHARDYAGYAGSFLRIGTTARSLAMGSGFTAELDRGFTAYHNPAGIPFLKNTQVSFTNHWLPLDRRFMATSFSAKLPPTAGIGVAWVSAGVDRIDGRTSAGEHTEYLSTSEDAVFISFAQKIQPWMAVGINIKILYQQLPMNSNQLAGKGTGFDIGVMVRASERMVMALVVQDLNSNYQWNTGEVFERGRVYKESFPTQYRIGSVYSYQGFHIVGDVGFTTDHQNLLGNSLRIGAEYRYRGNYFLRAGVGNSRIAIGGGLNYTVLKQNDAYLDYAFVLELPVGAAHVFTVAFNL